MADVATISEHTVAGVTLTTSNSRRVFGLDLLRASAVMLVLVAHASFMFLPLTHGLEAWWMLGQLGVELFFVLSGFLIGSILADLAAQEKIGIGRFWARRWLRTLPNYYLFLILNILIARSIDGSWPDAGRYFVFMQNFAWPQPAFFIESWSLAVEELFYLVAPLLVLLCRGWIARHIRPAVLVLLGIGALSAIRFAYVILLDPHWDEAVRMVALVRLDAIAYGALAMLWCRRPDFFNLRTARVVACAGAIGIVVSIALYLSLDKDANVFARTGWFSLISASFAALLPAASRWAPDNVPTAIDVCVRKLALWSYALYLCQLAIMRVMGATFAGNAHTLAGCTLQSFTFCTVSIAVAATVYHVFEAPLLRLRDRWTRGSSLHSPRT